MKRIICIGNRLFEEDAAGPLVFDVLCGMAVPSDIEVVDAGLAGIDLLRFFEGTERVVFVDAVEGDRPPGVVIVDTEEVAARASDVYGHDAGLGYALTMAPVICGKPLPEVVMVGVEGTPTCETVTTAANLSLELAVSKEKMPGLVDDVALKVCK